MTEWLLGSDANSVLAQEGNSAWEAALTIIFLADVTDILAEYDEALELRNTIRYKSNVVARWLLSRKITEGNYIHWERVTWDTSVVIRALLVALKKYRGSFSDEDYNGIIDAVVRGTNWLYSRFSQWDTQIKYPFGPADVAQIVITILHLANEYPDIYARVCRENSQANQAEGDLAAEIVEYLLHKKTEKTLTTQTGDGTDTEAVVYWWDDYFTTAEVVDALALFYKHCQTDPLRERYKKTLANLKEVLIRACTYFEQGQVDGMWGGHIDTLKVIYSYVTIRHMVPQRESSGSEPLIVPEIHTQYLSPYVGCAMRSRSFRTVAFCTRCF